MVNRRTRACFKAVWFRMVLTLGVSLIFCFGAANVGLSYQDLHADAVKCGPNALYVFLVLSGCSNVQFEQLNNMKLSPEGASVLELRDAARSYNIDTSVFHYNTNECASLPVPAIVLFRSVSTSAVEYHFLVVYKIDKRIYYVDGTTGEKQCVNFKWFSEHWTGYALVRHRFWGISFSDNRILIRVAVWLLLIDITICLFWLPRLKTAFQSIAKF